MEPEDIHPERDISGAKPGSLKLFVKSTQKNKTKKKKKRRRHRGRKDEVCMCVCGCESYHQGPTECFQSPFSPRFSY